MVVVDRTLEGVTLDRHTSRLVNGSAFSLVPGGFDVELMTHLESLGASGWEPVPTHGAVCGTVPEEPLPIEPGAEAGVDGARMGTPWIAGDPPAGPLRVASYVAVVVEEGAAYDDVRPRITERYTVSTPLDRLEDYAGRLRE